MTCNERADNMSKRKLTNYFKPGNNKNVRKNVDSTLQMSQLSRILFTR